MKIGRNDQCPCGSGKKYKKCCLPLLAPARRSPAGAQQVAGSARSESALAALQPEGFGSATDQPQFWDEYGMASVDARIDILRRVVEEEKEFDGELAYELLVDVIMPLQHVGRLEDADAALDLVRERQPGAYRDQASWFDEWRVENALLAGRDIEGPLLEFASRPEANVDGFFRADGARGGVRRTVRATSFSWRPPLRVSTGMSSISSTRSIRGRPARRRSTRRCPRGSTFCRANP